MCGLRQNVSAQTVISTINTATSAATSTTTLITSPSDASNSIIPSTAYNINYGEGNDVAVSNYVVSGITYDRFLAPDTLVLLRRISSDRLVNIWYQLNQINTVPAPDELDLDPSIVADADAIYLSGNLNAGYDNILVNDDDLASGSIEVETERVDVIWYSGIQTSDITTAVFPVIERGGNDNIAIAAITSLNTDGTPATYGTLIGIGETDWPGSGETFSQYLILRRQTVGDDPIPLIEIGSQIVQGVAVSFSELGISNNQNIFGYSLFAADVVSGYTSGTDLTSGAATVAGGVDLSDISTFPSSTLSSDSGLDLVAGVSAAVASDDNLIESVGPGGYKAALATWLKANDGAFVSDGGAASTEGNNVGFWEDQSPGNHDYTTLGTAPTFRSSTSSINFNPTVDFLNGTETGLQVPDSEAYNVKASNTGYDRKSMNIAFRTSANITQKQQLFEQGGGTNGLGIYIRDGFIHLSVWNRGTVSGGQGDWNDDGAGVISVSEEVLVGTEYIVTLEYEGDGTGADNGTITGYLNGQSFGVISDPYGQGVGLLYNHSGDVGLGQHDGASAYDDNFTEGDSFYGEIAEFIYCNEPASLPLSQRRRIESYLAIKYGITLDQSTPIDYLNSDGTVIFDATNSTALGGFIDYNNDIAGIGRDDNSELDQPASRSENAGSVVTIDRGATISTDDTWLIWGNDGEALTESSILTQPEAIDSRLERVWRVSERNEVLTTSVSFDITGLGLSTNQNDYSLLVASNSSSADFSGATVLTGGTLVGNTLTFTGVDLEDGQYFTLGTKFFQCSPGGVEDDLALWLKANEGTSTTVNGADVATWSDESGNSNNATGVGGNQPSYVTTSINFNPALDFDDANTEELTGSAGFHSVAYYMVVNPDDNLTSASTNQVLVGFGAPAGATDEFGALAFGSVTGAFAGEVVTHAIGGTGTRWRRGISSTTTAQINSSQTYLFGIRDNSGATSTDIFVDGLEQADLNSGTFLTSVDQDYEVGSYTAANAFDNNGHFDGQIGELISYSVRPDDAEHNRVQSYLAVKYGITLDQSTATNYTASDAGTIWNATDNSGFANDIAGIGRDDQSCLEQKQSRSQNSGSIVTMGLGEIAVNNTSNANSFASDDSFLIWGNDGASATEANAVAYSEGVVTERMLRIWKADENAGTVGATDISFDIAGLGYTGSLSDYSLIISDASGLTSPTIIPASSFSGDVVTFDNIDLTDGQFFTLGTARTTCSPGGVSGDLYVWLRADAGTSTTTDNTVLNTWSDQSGTSTDASQDGNAPLFKNNATDNINFNPTIDFDGTDDRLSLGNLTEIKSGAPNNGDYTMLAVGIRQSGTGVQYVLGSEGGTTNQDLHFGFRSSTQATIAHWGNDTDATINAFNAPQAPYLVFAEYDGSGRIIEEIRGGDIGRNTDSNTTDIGGTKTNFVGDLASVGNYNGLVSEVIVFDNDITDLQKQQIYTYLAIKYGITLTEDADNNAVLGETISGSVTEGDYVASDGSTVLWDYSSNTTYHNDVAGIGRDDDGCFSQKQSTAVDTDDILTIGLGSVEGSNGENVNGFDDNRDYLLWGNDDGTTAQASANTSDIPGSLAERISRVWKVQDTGNVGETELQFDLTGLGYSVADAAAFSLLVGNTATMADASIITGGTLNGNILSFTGVDLTDGQFFSVGTAFETCGPGGVNTDISVWFAANKEVFSDGGTTLAVDGANVIQWNDQSSPGINASEIDLGGGASAVEPTFQTNEINNNPVIQITDPNSSNASYLRTTSTAVTGNFTLISVFSTGQSSGTDEDVLNSPVLISSRNAGSLDHAMGMENGTLWLHADSDNGFEVQSTSTYNNNRPHFATATKSGTALNLFVDGQADGAGTGTATLTNATGFGIGNHFNFDLQAQYAGDIAETIVFSSALDSDQRNRVESYLALKYGITMNAFDNGGTGGVDERDYRAGDGGDIWDFDRLNNSTYYNDIFGIGRDDLSCFSQTQSKSENSDALVTFEQPGGSFSTDDSFILSGNDNAAIEQEGNNEKPVTINSRLNREWRVQETGTVGTIELTYDISTVTGPTGVGTNNLTQLRLMVDDDGDFSNGGTTLISPSAVDGSNETATFEVDFTDGQYYTLGSIEVAALPITLISFEANVYKEDQVKIDWTTASEQNNAFYTIERSTNGTDFETVSSIDGAGNSTSLLFYSYIDVNPIVGLSFYRLKQTDLNGEFAYSEIRSVKVEYRFESSYKLYPNPVQQGELLRISYDTAQDQLLTIMVLNTKGQIILKKQVSITQSEDTIQLTTSKFPRGLNLVRIIDENNQSKTLKLIVQ